MPNSFFLNSWGYQLISQGKTKEAVMIFEMMLEDFPNDPNLWDSAGEGYFANGQKDKAVEAFRKSITSPYFYLGLILREVRKTP